jgi:hypothetical protein
MLYKTWADWPEKRKIIIRRKDCLRKIKNENKIYKNTHTHSHIYIYIYIYIYVADRQGL